MPLQFFEDTKAAQPHIQEMIKKFGWAPEHNYFWYQYWQHYYDPPQQNIFVKNDHGGLFTAYDKKDSAYYVDFDPMGQPEHRVELLVEYITWIFSNTAAAKIWFQLEMPIRKALRKALPPAYACQRIYFTITWPVYNMEKFDPALPGGHYKTIRKEMHRFYNQHQVNVLAAKTFEDRKSLHAIVDNWKKNRLHHDRARLGVYHAMIDGNFEGADEARVLVVDGKPVGINAGWMIPNSDRFYGGVGIHDYSIEDLGTMLYLEDMVWLKNRGYREVDMGGSETAALPFKKKFLPDSFYKSAIFSVVKRNSDVTIEGKG